MEKQYLIARTASGGEDLYYSAPNLKGAKVVDVTTNTTDDDYCTNLTLETCNGDNYVLIIKQTNRRIYD